ncbi:MAG: metalloregulator ArsR/SmtB family transcription factor [Elusimicrobiota bacterium]|nr:MAG: metalloregulator ArsR/SmtB family transcription factor [Elusimicrobiota bacterium]
MTRTKNRAGFSIEHVAEAAIKADEAEEAVAREQAKSMSLGSGAAHDFFLTGKWVDRVMPLLRGVADSTRLRLIALLAKKEPMDVGQLAQALGVRSSTISQHLTILREAKVIVTEKNGIHTNCYLNRKFVGWRLQQLKEILHRE